MNISRIGNVSTRKFCNTKFTKHLKKNETDTVDFSQKNEEKKIKRQKFTTKVKNAFKMIFAAVASGLAVFAISSKRTNEIKKQKDEMETTNNELQNQNNELTKKNNELEKTTKDLQENNIALKNKIDEISAPNNVDEAAKIKIEELNSKELPYPSTPNLADNKKDKTQLSDIKPIDLPIEYQKSTLRNDAKELIYPEFKENEPYNFEFPQSSEIKITHDSTSANPIEKTITTISETYADSLVWDDDKIARDLLQNFYDGHGQTLDGVKFNVTPKENGKYTVKIEGKSTFSPDKAILLGETSKRNNDKAAGNYGEGLKMVVLKLLKDKGAENVDIVSNDWKVNWNFENTEFGKKALAYQLDKVEPVDGNYIEFDTDNVDFIKTIIKSFDRFYHYNNPAFKNPDFENDIVSIKFTDKNEKGRFYIAGQAFEVDGGYENLGGVNICIKKKPPVKYGWDLIFDPSRDRTSLTKENVKTIAQWLISNENMNTEEAVKIIHSFEKYWDVDERAGRERDKIREKDFLSGLLWGARFRNDIEINFPDNKCVAYSSRVSNELVEQYKRAGYRICEDDFGCLGMQTLDDLVTEARKHKAIEPTKTEKNKILILKEAIQLFKPILEEEGLFTDKELDTKIYIFDRNAQDENNTYKFASAEAIIRNRESLGFWVDKTTLNKESFSNMLGTSLHELTHKYGGDETSAFSYKLTDVMEMVFAAINKNPAIAMKLKVLEKAWDEQK